MQQNKSTWYQQPFVWLIVALLGVTVVVCIALMVVAVRTDDGLVVDDYYKRGNEVGKDIARDQLAATLGLSGKLLLSDDARKVRLLLLPTSTAPKHLQLTFAHPTIAGEDQSIALIAGTDGMLIGQLLRPLASHRWLVQVSDPVAGWRLRAEAALAPGSAIDLAAMPFKQ